MKSTLEYHISNCNNDDESSFIEEEGSKFTPLGLTPHGTKARSRFFGADELPKFIVKQPKPQRKPYSFNDLLAALKDPELIIQYQKKYNNELEIWNLVYPENKGYLFTEHGIRLVLPKLPGTTLSSVLINFPMNAVTLEDKITLCQIALAVCHEFKRFHQLGLSHNDFNNDNILIEKKPNNTYRAYLIDFDNVSKREQFVSNSESGSIQTLLRSIDNLDFCTSGINALDKYSDICHHQYLLLKTVHVHSEISLKLNEIKSTLSNNQPTLIRVKKSNQNASDYYVHGCTNSGQFEFTKLNAFFEELEQIEAFSGTLTAPFLKPICSHIDLIGGHIHYKLDLIIHYLDLRLEELYFELPAKTHIQSNHSSAL